MKSISHDEDPIMLPLPSLEMPELPLFVRQQAEQIDAQQVFIASIRNPIFKTPTAFVSAYVLFITLSMQIVTMWPFLNQELTTLNINGVSTPYTLSEYLLSYFFWLFLIPTIIAGFVLTQSIKNALWRTSYFALTGNQICIFRKRRLRFQDLDTLSNILVGENWIEIYLRPQILKITDLEDVPLLQQYFQRLKEQAMREKKNKTQSSRRKLSL